MSSPPQRIAKFSVLALLGSALIACGGAETPQAAAKAEVPGTSAAAATKKAAEAGAEAAKETVNEAAKETMAAAEDTLQEGAASAGAAVASTEPDLAAGEATYGRFCFSCHQTGVAGAPKLSVAEDWAPRIAKGLDMLVVTSIEGIPPGMPAKGLCMSCTEQDMRNTIAWMIAQ